jgi:hypothetical protein
LLDENRQLAVAYRSAGAHWSVGPEGSIRWRGRWMEGSIRDYGWYNVGGHVSLLIPGGHASGEVCCSTRAVDKLGPIGPEWSAEAHCSTRAVDRNGPLLDESRRPSIHSVAYRSLATMASSSVVHQDGCLLSLLCFCCCCSFFHS